DAAEITDGWPMAHPSRQPVMANVFDIELTVITVSGCSLNQRIAETCFVPWYTKNSYVSSKSRNASRALHHSMIRSSSDSSITAPVGLHGELMMTPRVRS